MVENLSLFALIYLSSTAHPSYGCWESFIIRLDILNVTDTSHTLRLRIFHYSPWYTYITTAPAAAMVENLSLFALIYLGTPRLSRSTCWESFIIRLDILTVSLSAAPVVLRIFHYSPWYTYLAADPNVQPVENLSLFALIYLPPSHTRLGGRWESFIIRLDILNKRFTLIHAVLRIFHYSPWYTYRPRTHLESLVENLSLFALIYLRSRRKHRQTRWESFIIRLDILSTCGF